MSILHSTSIDSTSSIGTITTMSPSDLANDPSNALYENRDHFQSIFTNDSRFFDTSLHLFKSYCTMGYIHSDDEKQKKLRMPFLTTPSNGHKHRWRPRLLGSHHNNGSQKSTLKAFLTPTLLRKNDHSTSIRSDSNSSSHETINHQKNPPMVIQYQRPPIPSINISEIDESEVTITRL